MVIASFTKPDEQHPAPFPLIPTGVHIVTMLGAMYPHFDIVDDKVVMRTSPGAFADSVRFTTLGCCLLTAGYYACQFVRALRPLRHEYLGTLVLLQLLYVAVVAARAWFFPAAALGDLGGCVVGLAAAALGLVLVRYDHYHPDICPEVTVRDAQNAALERLPPNRLVCGEWEWGREVLTARDAGKGRWEGGGLMQRGGGGRRAAAGGGGRRRAAGGGGGRRGAAGGGGGGRRRAAGGGGGGAAAGDEAAKADAKQRVAATVLRREAGRRTAAWLIPAATHASWLLLAASLNASCAAPYVLAAGSHIPAALQPVLSFTAAVPYKEYVTALVDGLALLRLAAAVAGRRKAAAAAKEAAEGAEAAKEAKAAEAKSD
ncbi:hypothetical protein HYH02_014451 [Chlamydomonas schloesseri]|uniref:Uncharacterized protein n=1 Tax=Chlamydomonas schloesseri TaxID=2026947 RepID=A0A835SQY1_9CHLO|nr:hypothetical protein HYH02_014451 [Chlamydomonas schloesseri]|eukprot:KAG2428103.1 hypothetical protein HYH02_014451 [Chlamydomonas schloesseri]